jgi:hypothetical protein
MSMNTKAVAEALAVHADQTLAFDPRSFYPRPPVLEVPAGADLAEVLQANWSLHVLDLTLRSVLGKLGAERVAAFRRGRESLPLRRDLSSFIVPADAPRDVRDFFAAMPAS